MILRSHPEEVIPVIINSGHHSLSAILPNDSYYGLIQDYHDERYSVWLANVTSLIPLKAHAWLNLTRNQAAGKEVDARNIDKHRTDVFRLAATLPGEPGPELPASIAEALITFLQAFPAESAEWTVIPALLLNNSFINYAAATSWKPSSLSDFDLLIFEVSANVAECRPWCGGCTAAAGLRAPSASSR